MKKKDKLAVYLMPEKKAELDQSNHRPPVQGGHGGKLFEMLGPPEAGAAVVCHQLHLGPQTVNGLLCLFRQIGRASCRERV